MRCLEDWRFRDLVHTRRRDAVQRNLRGPDEGLRIHEQGEYGGGRLRRLARPRSRTHRSARRPARDGRKIAPIQVPRRRRRFPDHARYRGPRRDRAGGQVDRPGVRRHQPGGLRQPEVLLHPRSIAGRTRHPRLARRPAGHRGGHAGGGDQRAQDRRQAARRREDRPTRHRGGRSGRRPGDDQGGHPGRELPRRRPRRRPLDRADARHGPGGALPVPRRDARDDERRGNPGVRPPRR